jgi:hypothetical protein
MTARQLPGTKNEFEGSLPYGSGGSGPTVLPLGRGPKESAGKITDINDRE